MKKVLLNYEWLIVLCIFRYQIIRITDSYAINYIIIALAILLLLVKREFYKSFLLLNASVLFLISINYAVYPDYRLEIKGILNSYIYIVLLPTFLFSYIKDFKRLFDNLVIFSFINIVITVFMFVNKHLYNLGYMDFGYFLIPSTLILYMKYMNCNKKIYLLFSLSTLFLVFIYGSRGAMLTFLVCYLGLKVIKYKKGKKLKEVTISMFKLLVTIVIFVLIMNESLIQMINNYIESSGRYSYSLTKYLDGNEEFMSGRDERYNVAINDILQNPIQGNGIGNYQEKYPSYSYVHNFILEIINELGIIIFILVFYILYVVVKEVRISIDYYQKLIYLFLLASSAKLFVSSQYWNELTFWLILLIGINKKLYRKMNYQIKPEENNISTRRGKI